MAKQLLRTYVFSPGGAGVGTISLPGKWDLNQILLITNATTNAFVYNFADATFAGTTAQFFRGATPLFPNTQTNSDGWTVITLAVSTSNMQASHNLQIFAELPYQFVKLPAIGTDAFERTRTAGPQSMLDADFEYGLQPTKWQAFSTLRNYPSVYEIPGSDLNNLIIITNASGGSPNQGVQSLITVTTQQNHGFLVNQPVSVAGLLSTVFGYARAQGIFVINSVPAQNVFTYFAKGKVGNNSGDVIHTQYTVLRRGGFYTGATIGSPTFSTNGGGVAAQAIVTVTFANNHGLIPGDGIITTISSDNGINNHILCQGDGYVETVPSPTSFTYTARSVGIVTGTPLGTVLSRPDAYFIHRPLDGGVSLGTGGPSHGAQAVRMSKKYIRYQSGKAINYNTGALFAPNYDVRSMTATNVVIGSTIYVTTDDIDHGLQVGAGVELTGSTTVGYNGVYTVNGLVDERTFTVISTQTLGGTVSGIQDPCQVAHTRWHGSTLRAGTFDDQNGIFWQYDGIQMAAVQRAATFQLAGSVSAIPDSNLITGNATRFDTQLNSGDRIVIKGMTHVVTAVTSATWMYVTPDYRGVTAQTGIKIASVIERIYPQSEWNVDRCDGSNGPFNPSGYYLIPNKMQMIGLQWTWYGAGFIDWMLRGPTGDYITVHRQKNSNINTEAFMRSGNMPVRYEITNEGARSILVNSISNVDTSMVILNAKFFPATGGVVYVDNELISFTGVNFATNTLTGLGRAATMTYFINGASRNFTAGAAAGHAVNAGVLLVSQTATPSISHWGSAFITDGGFDNDRGYIFNHQSLNNAVQLRKTTVFGIRLAPSVSNATTGDLGVRDLINRAQLLLQGIEITAGGSTNTNQALVIEGVLNPGNYPTNPANISWFPINGSIAAGNALGTGQPSFAQIAPGTGIVWDDQASYTTTLTAQANPGATTLSVASTSTMQVGDTVTTLGLSGNTRIQVIQAGSIVITQAVITTIPASSQVVSFSRNQFASPGETIFSFISSPQTKDVLDLTPIKELTSTPLGGRGTFPNGPDTLFINVYVTQGAPILANLVLRWGEAQA
jgi:hypothetical protein